MNEIHELPDNIATCNCFTKTNLPEHHKLKCPYRLLTQIETLTLSARKIHQWAEKNSNVEVLAAEMMKFKVVPNT